MNKYFLNIYIKKFFYYLSFILVLLLSSCQTPKYLQVKKITKSDSILPEVQYFINENFNPEEINCIAIGTIKDNSDKSEFSQLDKINLAKYSLYGHLSPKRYRDVEIHQMTYLLKEKQNINLVLKTLDCDAILDGEIVKFENKFYVAFSSTKVGLNLYLRKQNGELLWKGNHIASSRAGTIPLSPISLATGIFSASTNTEEEVALQMLDAAVRRLLKTIPDRKNVDNELAIKLYNAGVKLIYVGIETSDEEVKKNAHRSSEKNDTQIEKVNFLQKIGIDIKAMYIIGLPSDTEETYLKTLEFSKKISSTYAQFSVFTPYPGTPAFQNYKDKIITSKFENFNQWKLVFKHDNFDEKKIRFLLDLSYRKYYLRFTWIIKNFYKFFKLW